MGWGGIVVGWERGGHSGGRACLLLALHQVGVLAGSERGSRGCWCSLCPMPDPNSCKTQAQSALDGLFGMAVLLLPGRRWEQADRPLPRWAARKAAWLPPSTSFWSPPAHHHALHAAVQGLAGRLAGVLQRIGQAIGEHVVVARPQLRSRRCSALLSARSAHPLPAPGAACCRDCRCARAARRGALGGKGPPHPRGGHCRGAGWAQAPRLGLQDCRGHN